MHVSDFSCTPVASVSVIGLVLFWAQMCHAVHTQWTAPLSLIYSKKNMIYLEKYDNSKAGEIWI